MRTGYTVREVTDGAVPKGVKVFLETAWGFQEVTSVRVFSDGPWVVCGRENAGFGLSYCVTWDRELRTTSGAFSNRSYPHGSDAC